MNKFYNSFSKIAKYSVAPALALAHAGLITTIAIKYGKTSEDIAFVISAGGLVSLVEGTLLNAVIHAPFPETKTQPQQSLK